MPGLLPYINMYALRSLAANNSPPKTDNASTARLAAICHAGTPIKPRRIITKTGALNGKMLKTVQTGLFGNRRSKDKAQNGAITKSPYIPASPCASCTVEVMAAMLDDTTANRRYPRMKYVIPKIQKLAGM